VFDRAFFQYQHVKIQQNALKLFIILMTSTYMFRPAPAILRVGVIKYQVQFLKSVVKVKKGALATLAPGKNPGIHLIGGWVVLRTCLGGLEKKKISCLCQESNFGLSSP
jgi:hypothetical protein